MTDEKSTPMPGADDDGAGDGFTVCPTCGGDGLGADRIDGPGDVYQDECPECRGKGRVAKAAPSSCEADPVALDSWIKEMVDTWTEGDNQAEHFRRDVETLLRIARAAQFTRVEPKEKP